MGLMKYMMMGFGMRVGSEIAKDVVDGVKNMADSDPREAELQRLKREKELMAAASRQQKEKSRQEKKIKKELKRMKKQLGKKQ